MHHPAIHPYHAPSAGTVVPSTFDEACAVPLRILQSESRQIDPEGLLVLSRTDESAFCSTGEPLNLDALTKCLARLKHQHGVIFRVEARSSGGCSPAGVGLRPIFVITTQPSWGVLMQGSAAGLWRLLNESVQYSVHPYVWHFLNNFGDLDLGALSRQVFVDATEAMRRVTDLNHRIEDLRTALRSVETARAVDNLRRGFHSNLASLTAYVDGLFERHSRLLVIRIDLGYAQGLMLNPHMAQHGVVVSSRPEPCFPVRQSLAVERPPVTVDQIGEHREQLLAYIRRGYGKNFCGYAWKLEYGARKGYHFHLVLFFDGAHLRQDVTIAQLIGEHWRQVITGGLGAYYNCNDPRHTYVHRCVGPLSWDSPQRHAGLAFLCAYLLKSDLYVRLELAPGQRTFGKGGLPKLLMLTRRGRPRCRPSALA